MAEIIEDEAEGYAIGGDDMNWNVQCPKCSREYEFTGYFDSGDSYTCQCGCKFKTVKVWMNDRQYIT